MRAVTLNKRSVFKLNKATTIFLIIALLTTTLVAALVINSMNAGSTSLPLSTPTATPTQTPTPTPMPKLIPTPTPKPTPTLNPTHTPTPTSIATPTPTATPTPIPGPLWLQTSGQNIYDSNGTQVKLYTLVIQDGDGNHVSQNDIQKIKNMGFNAIRVFIEWGYVQPNGPNSVNTAYFTQALGASPTIGVGLDYVVNWASALGMYVIICPGWSDSHSPPSWATSLSGPSYYELTNGILHNKLIQSGIYYMYNWLGQHYASTSNVIFESFNEIATTTDSDASSFATFNNGWINAIESGEGGNSHLKIVELLMNWDNEYNYVLLAPYVNGTHANILLGTHDYPFVDSTSDAALDFAQTYSSVIHSQNLPWIDTEFSTAVGGTYSSLDYAVSLLAQYNSTGWGYFCYDSSSTAEGNYNINNPSNAASILPILQSIMIQS